MRIILIKDLEIVLVYTEISVRELRKSSSESQQQIKYILILRLHHLELQEIHFYFLSHAVCYVLWWIS